MKRKQLIKGKLRNINGFTLIETIAVLVILGIVAVVAISRVGTNQNDLIAQKDIVKSHLRFAQLKALSDDTSASWGIVFSANSYTLYTGIAAAAFNLPGEDSGTHTFPTGITITAITVAFDSWGSPGAANITVTLTQSGVTKSFRINANTGYIEDI